MRPLRFCHLTTFYPPHNFGGDGVGDILLGGRGRVPDDAALLARDGVYRRLVRAQEFDVGAAPNRLVAAGS